MNFPLQRFQNEFEFVWKATSQNMFVEWLAQNGDVFFRPRGADPGVLWHALDLLRRRTPAAVLGEALKIGQLRRALQISERETVFLALEEGIVHLPGHEYGAAFSIPPQAQMSDSEVLLMASPEELATRTSAILDNNPDFQSARLWLQNDPPRSLDIAVQRGTKRELELLLRALNQIFSSTTPSQFYLQSGFEPFTSPEKDHASPWLKVLTEHFRPRPVARYRVRGFSGWHRGYDGSPEFEGDAPTQHERLEALLLWRDFLRDKIPEEEIETLLRTT